MSAACEEGATGESWDPHQLAIFINTPSKDHGLDWGLLHILWQRPAQEAHAAALLQQEPVLWAAIAADAALACLGCRSRHSGGQQQVPWTVVCH